MLKEILSNMPSLYSEKNILSKLSPHLFWDVKKTSLDEEQNKSFIIKRVLEYGLWNDWLLIRKEYGLETITAETRRFRELDPKALAFISQLSGVPKENFRCFITKQLTGLHWNF